MYLFPMINDSTIYCITLKQTPERYEAARKHFEDKKIPVNFFFGIHGPTFGITTLKKQREGGFMSQGHTGLILSHYMLWSHIKMRGSGIPSLILEDDAEIPDDFWNKFTSISKQVPDDWELLYLGSNPGSPWEKAEKVVSENIAVMPAYATHAYMIKPSAVDILLATNHVASEHIDVQIIRNSLPFLKHYCITPSLITQRTNVGIWPTSL